MENLAVKQCLERIRALCENPYWSSDHVERRNRIVELSNHALGKLEQLERKGIEFIDHSKP